MKFLALPMLLSLWSHGAIQSPPRDPRPPVSDPNRQERALVAAAAANPTSAAAQHTLGVFYWEKTRAADAPAEKLSFVVKGLAAEDRALAINPDYLDAIVYKNILLRIQANLSTDPVEQKRLIEEADALRARALSLQRVTAGIIDTGGPPPAPPPPTAPLAGFDEPFDQAMARLTPVRAGGNIRTPIKTKDAKPVYPPDAHAAGVQGVVILEAIIVTDGKVVNARVLRSIPALDEAALGAVSQWQFQPTHLNGMPVPLLMTVTINFTRQ